jgi:hypothetical protein
MDTSRRRLVFGMGMGMGMGMGIGTGAVAAPSFAAEYLDLMSHPAPEKEVDRPIRLDRNENPYGPSPLAIAAMREGLEFANRYPDASKALREKIAGHHRVKPEQVLLTTFSLAPVFPESTALFASPSAARRR